MKYSEKEFMGIINKEIKILVKKYSAEFEDLVTPSVEELELAAEKVTAHLAKFTNIPMKTLISRFLWLYYISVKNN